MAHGPPEPPPADQPAEPSEVDVVDATAEAFRAAVAEGDLDRADRIAAALPRRELRDALRGLTPEQTEALYARLGDERLAVLLDPLEPEDAGDVLLRLTDAGAADVLDELEPDDAADVIAAIKAEEPERAQPILVEMDRAGDVQELLSFLPDTAGGRMTTEFVAVPPLATAEEAMRVLRAHARDGEVRSYVYATAAPVRRRGLHRHGAARVRGRAAGGRRADLLHPAPDRHRRQHRHADHDHADARPGGRRDPPARRPVRPA